MLTHLKSGTLTRLGAGHQVSLNLNDGNGVLLDRSWSGVAGQGDVPHDDLPHVHIMKLHNETIISHQALCLKTGTETVRDTYTLNVWWAVASSRLHGNIVVFLKVYPRVASREKLAASRIQSGLV